MRPGVDGPASALGEGREGETPATAASSSAVSGVLYAVANAPPN